MVTEAEVEALVGRARYEGRPVAREQLVGVEACLRQLGGQLALFARPELAERFGLEPSGTLFIGQPGTGKTLVARYLAGQLGLPFYQVSADEFGDDPELLHAFFRRLASDRAIAFVDEVSIIARRREWGTAEDRRMLAALLTSLDGVANDRGRLWVIGACTPDIQLDPAIHRSGRLGVVIEFEPPSEAQRRDLFRLYLGPVPHAVDAATIERLAEAAVGATGADIRDWVSQAASEVLAEGDTAEPVIEARHLATVVSRRGFIAAEDRPGREPDWETAVHEAAHSVVALVLFGVDSLARTSIAFTRRPDWGDADRGSTALSDDWARTHPPTSATWGDFASFHLAGVVAEQVILGYRGSGAGSDVSAATSTILAQLEAADPEFGPSRRGIESSGEYPVSPVGSEEMRAHAWALARSRFATCWERTAALTKAHRGPIEHVARLLLERRATLTGAEMAAELGIGASSDVNCG